MNGRSGCRRDFLAVRMESLIEEMFMEACLVLVQSGSQSVTSVREIGIV